LHPRDQRPRELARPGGEIDDVATGQGGDQPIDGLVGIARAGALVGDRRTRESHRCGAVHGQTGSTPWRFHGRTTRLPAAVSSARITVGRVSRGSMTPSWIQAFAEHQPITPVIETLRGLLLGMPVGSHVDGGGVVRGLRVVSVGASGRLFARRTG